MYVPFPLDEIELKAPVPVNIWDPNGVLLLRKGEAIQDEKHRDYLHMHLPMVLESEYRAWTYRYTTMLDRMVRDNQSLDDIAGMTRPMGFEASGLGDLAESSLADLWPDLHGSLSTLMHQGPDALDFTGRLRSIESRIDEAMSQRADHSLLVLVQMLSDRQLSYSASHAMTCAVIGRLVGKTLGLPPDQLSSLQRATLTMNIGMSRLHDQLARQKQDLSVEQRQRVNQHPELGEQLLRRLGVQDSLWLKLVRYHHEERLSNPPPVLQLLRTADVFVARISPRAARAGLPANQAAKDAYLGPDGQPTDIGTAFIKTLGIYVPGSYVRLATGEVAVVARRGRRANTPLTFAIVNKQGLPMGEPSLRDTAERDFEVKAGVSADEVKLRVNVSKLLARL